MCFRSHPSSSWVTSNASQTQQTPTKAGDQPFCPPHTHTPQILLWQMSTGLMPHLSSSSPGSLKLGGTYPQQRGDDWDSGQRPGSRQGFFSPEGLDKPPLKSRRSSLSSAFNKHLFTVAYKKFLHPQASSKFDIAAL